MNRTIRVSMDLLVSLPDFQNIKIGVAVEESFLASKDREACVTELFDAVRELVYEQAATEAIAAPKRLLKGK